jgi:hypothetical protein
MDGGSLRTANSASALSRRQLKRLMAASGGAPGGHRWARPRANGRRGVAFRVVGSTRVDADESC